jgi:hypothetical protein
VILLDTNVVIHLRDGDPAITDKVAALEGAVLGVFLALDLFAFYVFWELTLVPMYFIIGIWGYARRRYAAVKFFLYTFLGGLFMLLAVLVTFAHTGAGTFDYLEIREIGIGELGSDRRRRRPLKRGRGLHGEKQERAQQREQRLDHFGYGPSTLERIRYLISH